MAAILDEGIQYFDTGGAPLVNGKVYIGDVNADPVANLKNIFSDRELTIALANPQILDAFGRSTNKIWTDGKFSIQVDNSVDVQQFQDLDSGVTTTGATIIVLDSIVGSNTITASGGITSYTSNQQFVFLTALANTGPVTLNVDSIGAKAIVKNKDQVILPDEFEINQTIIVVYNATNDNFEWTNLNTKVSKGKVVQVVNVPDGDLATGITLTQDDDTIPQNNEGTEFITLPITPTLATNILRVDMVFNGGHATAGAKNVMALYQDSTANALAAVGTRQVNNEMFQLVLTHFITAGTTSETIFKMRVGANLVGVLTFNGRSGNRRFGGVMASSITITELAVA